MDPDVYGRTGPASVGGPGGGTGEQSCQSEERMGAVFQEQPGEDGTFWKVIKGPRSCSFGATMLSPTPKRVPCWRVGTWYLKGQEEGPSAVGEGSSFWPVLGQGPGDLSEGPSSPRQRLRFQDPLF